MQGRRNSLMLNIWEYDRDDEFDLDLEDIMVMEAIWISLQVSSHLLSDECRMESSCLLEDIIAVLSCSYTWRSFFVKYHLSLHDGRGILLRSVYIVFVYYCW
jgi:hypothetical protein